MFTNSGTHLVIAFVGVQLRKRDVVDQISVQSTPENCSGLLEDTSVSLDYDNHEGGQASTLALQTRKSNPSLNQIGPTLGSRDARSTSGRELHFNSRTRNKCFVCRYCDKELSSKAYVKAHERRHTGERPNKCQYCPKAFTTSSECKTHERCHTGYKPYRCSLCGKRFADSSNFTKHRKRHQPLPLEETI